MLQGTASAARRVQKEGDRAPSQVNGSASDIPYGTVATIKNFTIILDTWASMKRGFNENEMVKSANFIADLLQI
jgi:hypothetical protein